MKLMKRVSACALATFAIGCATITEGTTQDISVVTNPSGATCIFERQGLNIGTILSTPATLNVPKRKYDITIRCKKTGYQEASYLNHSGLTAVVAANVAVDILLTAGASSIIDSSTGADNKYDSAVNLTLTPEVGTQAASLPEVLPISAPPPRVVGAPDDIPASRTPIRTSDHVVRLESDSGTYVVPVLINGVITLKFTVDSGASDVSIPADVVLTLMRAGTITGADFLDKKTYRLADGSEVPSQRFRLRSLTVGDVILEGVTGSIADVKGSLLLGQSFLGRLKSWSIDNEQHALVIELGAVARDAASPPVGKVLLGTQ